ncbi:hypothetical protein [Mycobacterium hubeiense]|uniref:hypothetical protein n=1 Tax=Mycobacterium hubeiense TaxID=1867256 RepID=UPI0018EE2194|nr:hypothetical protein [Mycobacterium sp. QGD 101]
MLLVPSALPILSRRRVLFGAAALALLGATASACGSTPPPELDDLTAQRDRALADSQLAKDAAAGARPQQAKALTVVADERSEHARALSEELIRMVGDDAPTTTTTSTTAAAAKPPTSDDVVDALKQSAESAAKLAAQLSGYRAGLLGSIAAACTAAHTVMLAPAGGTP